MRLFRVTKALVLAGLLAVSLAFNVATVALTSVATLVSGAYELVTGAASVIGQRDRELRAANRKVSSLSDEVADLKQPKSVTYRGDQRLLSQAVSDTTERISRRTVAGATRNAGAVIAEGIPVAGIAVVLGVTAWDLADACETLKDLQELELAFNPDAEVDSDVTEVCGLTLPTKEEVWEAIRSSPGAAWDGAKAYLPELPELSLPDIDWTPWN